MFTLWRVVEPIRCSIVSYPDCVGRFVLASFHKQFTIWVASDCRRRDQACRLGFLQSNILLVLHATIASGVESIQKNIISCRHKYMRNLQINYFWSCMDTLLHTLRSNILLTQNVLSKCKVVFYCANLFSINNLDETLLLNALCNGCSIQKKI